MTFPRVALASGGRARRGIGGSLRRVIVAVLVCQSAVRAQSAEQGSAAPRPAVNPETAPRPTARATRITRPITVDARLDEPEWQLAEPMTDFVQQLPNTGHPAVFRTVTRVLYDADHLWVGAVNYDPDPSRAITAGLERDFNSSNSDVFGVVLDTFHDRRNSFLFLINPHGAVRDEQTYNDSRTIVEAWEGIITVRTAVTDSGWIVEMEIPMKTLRFDKGKAVQAWGMNVLRRVRRVNESSYWAPLERQYRLHRMSKAGTLTGLQGLHQGRNLQVKPFALGGTARGREVPAASAGSRFDAGLDLKYGVTPSLTLDATYNTDFSQVEVDQEQVNLTRFSLFFPERREFFIENAGSFTFGDVQERNFRTGTSLSNFSLFNSRQIGLTNTGRIIPIAGGGRLTGRMGKTELGLLDMRTERGLGLPAENFAVARARRNVFGSSDVGVIVLNRQASDTALANTSYGVDANIRLFGNNMVVNSYYAASTAKGASADGDAARIAVGFRNPFWDASAMWKRVDEDFIPGLGFIRRRGMQDWYGTLGVHARPASARIQELNPYVEAEYITNLSSALDTRTLTAGLEVFFRPDGQLSIEFNDQFDRLAVPFNVVPGATIPAGAYGYRDASVKYQAGQSRPLYGNVQLAGGEYYNGTRRTVSGGLTWRARYDLSVDATYQRNDIALPTTSFHADVAGARLRYAVSTRLFGSAFFQYNSQAKTYVTNARVNVRYAPLSDVFLVYTERRSADSKALNERSVALKVTRMVAF